MEAKGYRSLRGWRAASLSKPHICRTEYIANVVAEGISAEEKEQIEAKRMLNILGQIGDDQVIILARYLHRNFKNEEFLSRHKDILSPPPPHMQSSTEELDKATMTELARRQLISLSLLRPRFKQIKKGELPEFDQKTGLIKQQSTELTPLGRLLLRYIGLAEQGEM